MSKGTGLVILGLLAGGYLWYRSQTQNLITQTAPANNGTAAPPVDNPQPAIQTTPPPTVPGVEINLGNQTVPVTPIVISNLPVQTAIITSPSGISPGTALPSSLPDPFSSLGITERALDCSGFQGYTSLLKIINSASSQYQQYMQYTGWNLLNSLTAPAAITLNVPPQNFTIKGLASIGFDLSIYQLFLYVKGYTPDVLWKMQIDALSMIALLNNRIPKTPIPYTAPNPGSGAVNFAWLNAVNFTDPGSIPMPVIEYLTGSYFLSTAQLNTYWNTYTSIAAQHFSGPSYLNFINQGIDGYLDNLFAEGGTLLTEIVNDNSLAAVVPPFDILPYVGPATPVVWTGANFTGKQAALEPGNYNYQDLINIGIGNDAIQSIEIPPSYAVTLYQNANYGGAKVTLTGDQDNLTNYFYGVADSSSYGTFSDSVSSLVVTQTT